MRAAKHACALLVLCLCAESAAHAAASASPASPTPDVAFGGLDIVSCVGAAADGLPCHALGNSSLATKYTSMRRDGTPAFTAVFWFSSVDNLIAFENAPFTYLPKFGGFDPTQIASGARAAGWRSTLLGPAVDLVNGWSIIRGDVFVFANSSRAAAFDNKTQHAAEVVWEEWFGRHGLPPYAVAAGPFNTRCFSNVPSGSISPAGQDCHHHYHQTQHRHSSPPPAQLPSSLSYLRGIDVSHYQGTIQWHEVAASGIQFACAKATEGTTYVDPNFRDNWEGMRSAGLTRCAYHFAHPGTSATDQAKHFVETVEQAGGYRTPKTLQLMLDLETADGKTASEVRAWTEAFIGEIKALTGRPGIIYTGYYFWRDSVGGTDNFNCPLWVASYTHPAPVGIPAPWQHDGWTFWQYDDNAAASPGAPAGSIPGIAGHSVDVDYFRYDEATLQRFCFPNATTSSIKDAKR